MKQIHVGRTRRGVPFGGEESNGSESTETPSKKAKPGPQVIFIRRLICGLIGSYQQTERPNYLLIEKYIMAAVAVRKKVV